MRITPFLVSLLLLTPLLPLGAALDDPNAALDEWVEGDLRIAQPDLVTLDITGTITLRKYTVEGTNYRTADDIGGAYQQLVQADQLARSNGQPGNRAAEFVTDLETSTNTALDATLRRAFPTATVTVEPASVDTNTLAAPAGDPYLPGVQIAVAAKVQRSYTDLGLADISADGIDAIFSAGAEVTTDLALSASSGYDMTYTLSPPAAPAGLTWSSATPSTVATATASALTIRIDNSAGTDIRTETVQARLVDPVARANMPTAEDVPASVVIQLGGFTGATEMPLVIDAESEIRSVDVAARFPDALPASVDLPFLSADALRALYQTGVIGDDDLASINDGLADAVKQSVSTILPEANATGGISETDLAEPPAAVYGTDNPVEFAATVKGGYGLPAGAENADIALRMGALITFDLTLPASAKRDTQVEVKPPAGLEFTDVVGGTLANGGASFVVPQDATETPLPVKVTMRDPRVRTYTSEEAAKGASFGATIDLQDIDISIGKAIGGDMGNLLGEIRVDAKLGVFEVPAEFKASLPEGVDLQYITSDGVRLLRQRGIITDDQIAQLESAFLENVTTNLRNALQVPIQVSGGLSAASIAADAVGDVLTGDSPIVLSATASFAKPLSGAAPEPTAASAIYSMPQTFTLPSVQGLPTTYKIILPAGITVSDINVDGGKSETGTENGREYFVVTPEEGREATASMNIGVTPGFVVAKFWPVLLLAVLIIFLLVGTPIAFVVMRRRKANAAAAEDGNE